MPDLRQTTPDGKWEISKLTIDTDVVEVPITLTYNGINVDYTVNSNTHSKMTDWATPLGTPIDKNAITFTSSTVTVDGTAYKIGTIEWDSVTPYPVEPEPVITYEFVVSGGSASTYEGHTNVGAWYITKTDGETTNVENVTTATTWTITAGGSVATASTTTKGRIDYNNNSSTAVTVTVKGTYNGNTKTTSFNVPGRESVITYELEIRPSSYTPSSNSGNKTFTSYWVKYVDGQKTEETNVTTATTWTITAGSSVATASTTTKGRIDYNNTSTASTANVTVKAEYSGESDTVSFTVPKKSYEPVITYSLEVRPYDQTATTYNATVTCEAWYITKTDGVVTNEENVTNSATWTIGAGSFSIVSVNNGTVVCNNTGNTLSRDSVVATYQGKSGTGYIKIPAQQHTFAIQPNSWSEGTSSGYKDLVAYYDATAVTGVSWSIVSGSTYATISSGGRVTYNNTTTNRVSIVVKATYQSYEAYSVGWIEGIINTDVIFVPVYKSVDLKDDSLGGRIGYYLGSQSNTGYRAVNFTATTGSQDYSYKVLNKITTSGGSLDFGITNITVGNNKLCGEEFEVYATLGGRSTDAEFIEKGYFKNSDYGLKLSDVKAGSYDNAEHFSEGTVHVDFNTVWSDVGATAGTSIAVFVVITATKAWDIRDNWDGRFIMYNTALGDTDFTANTFDAHFILTNNTPRPVTLNGIRVYFRLPREAKDTRITFDDEYEEITATTSSSWYAGYFNGNSSYPVDKSTLWNGITIPANSSYVIGKNKLDECFDFSDDMQSKISGKTEAAAFWGNSGDGRLCLTCTSQGIYDNDPLVLRPYKKNN